VGVDVEHAEVVHGLGAVDPLAQQCVGAAQPGIDGLGVEKQLHGVRGALRPHEGESTDIVGQIARLRKGRDGAIEIEGDSKLLGIIAPVELAAEAGHSLPTTDPDDLRAWFAAGAGRRDLDLYLSTFTHTVACLQSAEAIERAAHECVEDLAADGVVYAEVRMAPELCIEGGLTPDEATTAMLAGFRRGTEGRTIDVGLIVTAMRHAARSAEIAEVALRHLDEGVVGFDIAGSESGNPPSRHLDAFRTIAGANSHITIHAGEAFGLASIWEALQICGPSGSVTACTSSTTSPSTTTAWPGWDR
jgi:hypothetical protein